MMDLKALESGGVELAPTRISRETKLTALQRKIACLSPLQHSQSQPAELLVFGICLNERVGNSHPSQVRKKLT